MPSKLQFGDLKLAQKGLLLISLPLLLQISFFAIYDDLFSQSESLVKKESKDKNLIGRSNWIGNLILTYCLSAVAQTTGLASNSDELLNNSIEASRSHLKDLAEMLKTDDKQSAIVREATKTNENLIAVINATRTADAQNAPVKSKEQLKEKVAPLLQRLYELRHALLANEVRQSKVEVEVGSSNRQRKRTFIIAAIVFDVLLAVLVFWVFTREITGRLDGLVKNNDLFANHLSLNPPLPGSDEVAQLDRSFHNMAMQIRQAEARKQEYIQMISHDMRTPLTSLLCCFDILTLPEFNVTNDGLTRLQNAQKELTKVLTMINSILEIERWESGAQVLHQELVSIGETIAIAIQSVAPLAEEAQIKISVQDSPPLTLMLDREKIVRVLVNILANAIKFSHEQTSIKISWCATEENTVKVMIEDQGRGIPNESLATIFERFKQVDSTDLQTRQGTGLGLYICKAIVESHKGRIGAQSAVGQGSVFWFELPLIP